MKSPGAGLSILRKVIPILLIPAGLIPGQQQQPQGQLDVSPSLFSVLAAIGLGGYDAEWESPANHPIRAQVRQYLAAKNLPIAYDLKRFLGLHRQKNPGADLAQYISFALSVEGPPDFKFHFRTNELPPDVMELQGFDLLMQRFHKEAGIDELWTRAQPAFEQALARYHEPVSKAVLEVNAYLRNSTSSPGERRFQIYLDLLGPPNQIQTRTYSGDYFIVITPSPEPQITDVRHVYLHYLLDPIAMRSADALDKKRALGDYAKPAPLLAQHYKDDFVLLAGASLVRAVEARLAPSSERAAMVDEALREGFILTPYFASRLPDYEKQDQSMRLYFAEMVHGLDLQKEDRRLERVEFATQKAVRLAKAAPKRAEPELSPTATMLEQAEQLYTARNLDQARLMYLKVLEQDSEKSLHAKAYYGLARIAALQRDPELAERLFQKTLDSSPDDGTRAWSHVYLARLSEAAGRSAVKAGRPDEGAKAWGQAVEQYRAALTVQGATDAAKQAAQQGLAAAEKNRP